jgi:hypothetical protein
LVDGFRWLAIATSTAASPTRLFSTATSCGYGVPVMAFGAQRTVRERGRRYKVPRKA